MTDTAKRLRDRAEAITIGLPSDEPISVLLADAASDIERMLSSLKTLAMQHLTDEMDGEELEHADFIYAYDAMIRVARGAVNQ